MRKIFVLLIALACMPAFAGNHIWSDSEGLGANAPSPSTQGFAALLNNWIGFTNHSVSGDQVADATAHVYSINPVEGDIHIMLLGLNDEQQYCPAPCTFLPTIKQGYFQRGIANLIAFLATPTKHSFVDGSPTFSGSCWTTTLVYGRGKNTNCNGDFVTFSCSGTGLLLGMIQQDGTAGTFDIYIDGVLVKSDTTLTTGLATINGATYGGMLQSFPGLSAGSHTFKVIDTTPLPNVSANRVYVDWYACTPQFVFSNVYVGNIIYAQDYSSGGSNANVDYFNNAIDSAISLLNGTFGLRVKKIDTNSVVDPLADMDGAKHPVISGHAKIGIKFFTGIQ